MAALTPVYYYTQRQTVVLVESGASIATRRYETVYSKELTINKGSDNTIEFAFINQDQKKVDITGKDVTFTILSYDGQEKLLEKTLTPIYAATGLTSIQLSSKDIEAFDAQKCSYTLTVKEDSASKAVFVDAMGGVRGILNIVPGTQPTFVPSTEVTVPDHSWSIGAGANVTYYSSIFETKERDHFTVQTNYSNFTGYTNLIGSTVADFSTEYEITQPQEYTASSDTVGTTVIGYHPYVKLKIENHGTINAQPSGNVLANTTYYGGDVVKILLR
jgi:hypothetical protein